LLLKIKLTLKSRNCYNLIWVRVAIPITKQTKKEWKVSLFEFFLLKKMAEVEHMHDDEGGGRTIMQNIIFLPLYTVSN
jgi:hypothetical protein